MKLMLFLFPSLLAFANLSTAQTEYLTQINPHTGAMTKLDGITGVKWIRIVNYVYNGGKKQYSFIGMNNDETEMALYTIDVISGNLVCKAVMNLPKDDNPANFAYDRQSGSIYGIYWNAARSEEYFVRVNEQAGTFDSVSFFPDIKWIKPNTQCINEYTNQYTFVGMDSSFQERYCTVDIATGQVFQSNIITQYDSADILIMKYDKKRNKYYAIITSGYPWMGRLEEIDVITGISKRISGLPEYAAVGQTQYTYNSEQGLFYLGVYPDTSDIMQLYAVSITDGNLVRATQMPLLPDNDNLICYEYDAEIDKIIALHWETETNYITDSIIVYPNPVSDYIIIDFKNHYDNLIVVIFDMQGKVVKKNGYTNAAKSITLYTDGLANADYILTVFDRNKSIIQHKILVQR